MNKRIRKKHYPYGTKRAGLMHCRCEIGNHIVRKCKEVGIKYNRRSIWSYTHWLSIHTSEEEWSDRVSAAHMNYQMLLSAKHLLPAKPDYTSFNGRYKPNPPIKEEDICSEASMKKSGEQNMSTSSD